MEGDVDLAQATLQMLEDRDSLSIFHRLSKTLSSAHKQEAPLRPVQTVLSNI